jgi:uncharacterized coiled-coil protein SlyX
MKFDMQKAREICEELLHPGEDCGASCQFCDEAKTMLPAALDEIDRQANRISALEQKLLTSECREREAMRRMAELEGNLSDYKKIARDLDFDLTKKAKRVDKQCSALKKLGQDKRARGKALVEERAHRYLNLERNEDIVAWELDEVSENEQKRLRYNAREQLHQEGKL